MNISSGKELSQRIMADMNKTLSSSPRVIARLAINFMEDNFEKGGFQSDEGKVDKWEPRKNDDGSGRGVLIGKQSGRLQKSGTVFKADQQSVIVGVPDNIAGYGRIHNEGGTVRPKVTDKMRKFAWFKYYQEGGKDVKTNKEGGQYQNISVGSKANPWKWLALTKKKRLEIKLPKRQFLGNSPVLSNRIVTFISNSLSKTLKGSYTIKR